MTLTQNHEQIFPRPLSGEPPLTQSTGTLPVRAAIVGKLVSLEPQDPEAHAEQLYEAGHGTAQALQIWDYLTYGPWPDVASYKTTLASQANSHDPLFFSVRVHATGKVCGQISIMDINAANGSFEIGHIWFGPELQRTRAATEALFLAMDYPMSQLHYRRLQWRCNSLNSRSRTAAQRLGFRFEGIFYNHLIFKGMNRDTAWYSILDDEWPEVRAKMQAWLDDSNFDAQGQALQSLAAMMSNRMPSQRRL